MSLTQNLDIVAVEGETETVTIPKFLIKGVLAQDNGEGHPSTTIIDFNAPPYSESDGSGSSVGRLIGTIGTNVQQKAKLLALLKDKAFELAMAVANITNN